MPREIDGKKYYETTEVCEKVGISRPTLFRWLKQGLLSKMHKDRRGWRLFTEDDLRKIRAQASRIVIEEYPLPNDGMAKSAGIIENQHTEGREEDKNQAQLIGGI